MTSESPKKKGRTVKLDSAKKVVLTNVKDNPEPVVIESDTGLTGLISILSLMIILCHPLFFNRLKKKCLMCNLCVISLIHFYSKS